MDLIAQAKAEVVNRHRFFVDWFTGRAPDAAMEDAARAFAPDMQMVGPDATLAGAAEVVAMLRAARGKRPADFAIRVELVSAQVLGGDLVAVIYDEHQRIGETRSARRSSAVFSADAHAPEGVVWRLLQETWKTTP